MNVKNDDKFKPINSLGVCVCVLSTQQFLYFGRLSNFQLSQSRRPWEVKNELGERLLPRRAEGGGEG